MSVFVCSLFDFVNIVCYAAIVANVAVNFLLVRRVLLFLSFV